MRTERPGQRCLPDVLALKRLRQEDPEFALYSQDLSQSKTAVVHFPNP